MKAKALFFIAIASSIALYGCSNCCSSSSNQERPAGRELQTASQVTTVQTVSGKVAGYIDGGIYTYKGIPYAKAERFMPWFSYRY